MGRLGDRFRRTLRQAKRLLDFVMGLAFLLFAAAGGEVALRLWKEHVNHPEHSLAGFDVIASFTVVLIIFSLYSFAKARSVR